MIGLERPRACREEPRAWSILAIAVVIGPHWNLLHYSCGNFIERGTDADNRSLVVAGAISPNFRRDRARRVG